MRALLACFDCVRKRRRNGKKGTGRQPNTVLESNGKKEKENGGTAKSSRD